MRDPSISPAVSDSPRRSLQETFSQIYESGVWTLVDDSAAESRSGLGSNLVQTAALRSELPRLVGELRVSSLLDAPCGDFFWMSMIELGVDTYIGADIVPGLIERNRVRFARPNQEFRVIDLTQDQLPQVDLIFSRDCLVHLSDRDIHRALINVKRSGSKYLATTTFTERTRNAGDMEAGGWRPLNLCLAPFLLPKPFRLINEQCTEVYVTNENGVEVEHRFADKSIGVWRIADL
ncbi:class I SAM-dependent methyltransferase [Streptomyces caniferus]|uniref:class I SAM-dependent methyltransferase n=1 Tax=Streptomyces caniferus TaxID=285557 RepID=UPI00381E60AE